MNASICPAFQITVPVAENSCARFYEKQSYPSYSPGFTCSPLVYCGRQTVRNIRVISRPYKARISKKRSNSSHVQPQIFFSDRSTTPSDYCSRVSTPDSIRSGRQHPLMPHTNVDAIPFYPNIFLGECERWNLHIKE
ncbi:unnamed protein product [Bursaphelenchus okinawaensis]|uniref:Uncharacterized protein n=1 Tax=Bursaphelenchus okinawaensis TaxID=465554 RepID=A0A811JRZ0_9BILA|nr:unnamed protein product [Bursaphelenchus okinawaensis]CAG9080139.1 unnamed protein product [Bursaphelenchus okinawaensis]